MSAAKVVLFLPSLDGGGVERVFVQLANDFAALGVSVDLALAAAKGPYLREVDPVVRVVDLKSSGVSRSLPGLARHLRTERPDVILSGLDHANVTSVVARSLTANGTRCIISSRSVPTMLKREAGIARAWPVLQLARIAYRFADAVIANSEGVADDLSRYFLIPRNRIRVIYNPLSLESIERLSAEPPGHPSVTPGPPVIMSMGRLSGLKDFPTLLRAFSLVRCHRPCRLVILGEGPDRGRLEALAGELGMQGEVLLPGFIDNPFAWLRRAAVFVSSSLSEGCPNALMQALACGTPVVSTDCVGGSREIVEGGKWGKLVAVGDATAMAEAIEATLDADRHPDVRRRAADFAHEKIARQYLQVLLPNAFPSLALH